MGQEGEYKADVFSLEAQRPPPGSLRLLLESSSWHCRAWISPCGSNPGIPSHRQFTIWLCTFSQARRRVSGLVPLCLKFPCLACNPVIIIPCIHRIPLLLGKNITQGAEPGIPLSILPVACGFPLDSISQLVKTETWRQLFSDSAVYSSRVFFLL